MNTSQTPPVPAKNTACAWIILLLAAFMETARAEVPFDPPGTYSTSWLGNTYMDAAGHKNVTEELADLCLSPNGRIFSAGYAETWGGGADYQAGDGGFIARYDRFELYRQETATEGEVLVPSFRMGAGGDKNNYFYNPQTCPIRTRNTPGTATTVERSLGC